MLQLKVRVTVNTYKLYAYTISIHANNNKQINHINDDDSLRLLINLLGKKQSLLNC